MEFPELGEHCTVSSCRQLDFLPMKCAGCQGLYCMSHFTYASHNCSNPGLQDKQVPICPLCNAIVPVRPGESPDERVGQHIDTACKSKPALELKGKIFTNACSFQRCKKREAVSCICAQCGLNFCISHRNELDHSCQGAGKTQQRRVSSAGAAAIFRAVFQNRNGMRLRNNNSTQSSTATKPETSQGQDSASLAKALQEEEDRKFAIALAASLNSPTPQQTTSQSPTRPPRQAASRENSCVLS